MNTYQVHRRADAVQRNRLVIVSITDLYFDLRVDYATRHIAVVGEFDASTAECLATAVAGFQRAATGDITINLDDVTYIDAAGLGAVGSARSAQTHRGDLLTVTGVNADLRRVFILGKLADLLQPAA